MDLSYCFHSDSELSYGKTARLTARLILAIFFNLICLTSDYVSGILDTTDTNFLHPCLGSKFLVLKQTSFVLI